MATDVWTNKTVMVDHVEAKPFGNGTDVCPVCGKPSTIGKPITNADRIRAMSDEALAGWLSIYCRGKTPPYEPCRNSCEACWLDWLREEAEP